MAERYRVGILGADGYIGADLVRLLLGHPAIDITLLTGAERSESELSEVFPHLGTAELPALIALDDVEWPALDLDIIFSSLPHAAGQDVIKGLFHATGHTILDELVIERREDLVSAVRRDIKVIDLSGDFRLTDPKEFERWYGEPHTAADLQPAAVYGLTETNAERIGHAHLVACPGPMATAILLALGPLLEAKAIDSNGIAIDAKFGISVAGRDNSPSSQFCDQAHSVHPMSVGDNAEIPEIEQELGSAARTDVAFSIVANSVPISRGILITAFAELRDGHSVDDLRAIWDKSYAEAPFVRSLPPDLAPDLRQVRGSNFCVLNAFEDRLSGRVIVMSALDNLVKGGAGQAIQNMNLMLGLRQTDGLGQMPLFP